MISSHCSYFLMIGNFYSMYHMDADVAAKICGLTYTKGAIARTCVAAKKGFDIADMLVNAGYAVTFVEQTETSDQLNEREGAGSVVNREVYAVMTAGTRCCHFFCRDEREHVSESTGPLLAICEIALVADDTGDGNGADEDPTPVYEYGITLINAAEGSVTIGQFKDNVLRSALDTLLASCSPSEVRALHIFSVSIPEMIFLTFFSFHLKKILLKGGRGGSTQSLRDFVSGLRTAGQQSRRVEYILPTEIFPISTACR